MKIILFSFLDELSGDGARVISACLKEAGHQVKCVFLPFYGAAGNVEWVDELEQDIADADMYMCSVMSCYEDRAVLVTEYLKNQCPDKPVIWGGVHATSLPESCAKHADYVIRGECETPTVEFVRLYAEGGDYRGADNVAYIDESGEYHQNPLSQLPFELDEMPFPDYDIEDHYVLDGATIQKANLDIYERLHTTYFHDVPAYFIITTRGCPFVCTYCHQSELINTYPNKEYKSRLLRYKSVDRSLAEIRHQLDRLPFIKAVGFSDDDFFCRKKSQIREFAERYPKEIGLPFGVAAIPLSVTEEKLQLLLDAGCTKIQIGIQSGSDRLNSEVYQRHHPRAKLIKAVELLDKYHDKYDFGVDVDWIIDCPWETEDDVFESVYVQTLLPDWMNSQVFTLTFYPGTAMWNRAVEEGLITDDTNVYEQAFNQMKAEGHSYLTHVFLLHNRLGKWAPRPLIRALSSNPARWVGDRIPNWALNGVWDKKVFPALVRMAKKQTKIGAPMQFS